MNTAVARREPGEHHENGGTEAETNPRWNSFLSGDGWLPDSGHGEHDRAEAAGDRHELSQERELLHAPLDAPRTRTPPLLPPSTPKNMCLSHLDSSFP
jgi:hypothetical protein